MLKQLYDKVIALSASRHALPALAAVSFAESSFFPVPPDIVLVPMALAQPQQGAALCARLHHRLGARRAARLCHRRAALRHGRPLADLGLWLWRRVEAFRAAYAKWGAWIILIKGMTPIPYKIVTIASGFAGYNLALFLRAVASSRGACASSSRRSCCASMASRSAGSSRTASPSSPPASWRR